MSSSIISSTHFFDLCIKDDPTGAIEFFESIPHADRLPFVSWKDDREDWPSSRGNQPLHAAARMGHFQLAQLLIQSGAEVDAMNDEGCTSLLLAARYSHHQVVELLLAAGADKDAANKRGSTPLYYATVAGDLGVVETLLKAGAKNAADHQGWTPLHAAARQGRHQLVEMLLAGADVNASDNDGATPIYTASFYGHHQVVDLLLTAGADPHTLNKFGRTLIHVAADRGHHQVVELLLAAGADKTIAKNHGPIWAASSHGHHQVVEMLLIAGADKNTRVQTDATPLLIASQYGHHQVVELLLAAGADKNAVDNMGFTPIFLASQNGFDKVVEMLLAAGADINRIMNNFCTPIYTATWHRRHQVVEVLLAAGADPNIRSKSGKLPIEIARQKSHYPHPSIEIEKLLSSPPSLSSVSALQQRLSMLRTRLQAKSAMLQAKIASYKLIQPFKRSIKLVQQFSSSLDWISSSLSAVPKYNNTICFNNSQLQRQVREWIDSQRAIHQSLDDMLAAESHIFQQYKQAENLTVTASSIDRNCLEDLLPSLQQHIETLGILEKPPTMVTQSHKDKPQEERSCSSSSSSSASSAPFFSNLESLTSSTPHALLAEIQVETDALQSLSDDLHRQQSVLQQNRLDEFQQYLQAITNVNGSSEEDMTSGMQLIKQGFEKRLSDVSQRIEEINAQLTMIRELSQLIATIEQSRQEKLTELGRAQDARESQRQKASTLVRQSTASLASVILQLYRGQISFFSDECRSANEKLQRAQNSQKVGLKGVIAKLQAEVDGYETMLTSIDSKIKQIEALRIQFDLPILASSSDQTHSDAVSVKEEGELLIGVREKEQLMMQEAIHAVEQVAEYGVLIESIQQQNKDLKGRLMDRQRELFEILVCPITQEVMLDPVLAADNHTYERQAIEMWLRNNSRSPMTNQELAHRNLESNWLVKNLLEKMRQMDSSP